MPPSSTTPMSPHHHPQMMVSPCCDLSCNRGISQWHPLTLHWVLWLRNRPYFHTHVQMKPDVFDDAGISHVAMAFYSGTLLIFTERCGWEIICIFIHMAILCSVFTLPLWNLMTFSAEHHCIYSRKKMFLLIKKSQWTTKLYCIWLYVMWAQPSFRGETLCAVCCGYELTHASKKKPLTFNCILEWVERWD